MHERVEFGVALSRDMGDRYIGRLEDQLKELLDAEPPLP